MPKISVLMPVYNADRYVSKAIESILNQTFSDFEFIIIDDGSTDNSLAILKSYQQKDERIRLISRENRGLTKTLNEGLALAKSLLIARMDADDIALPDRFEKQHLYLEHHPECSAVGSSALIIDPEGDPLTIWKVKLTHAEIDAAHFTEKTGNIIHPSVMIRKDKILAVNGYSDNFKHAEDFDLWLRMAEVGHIANLPDILLYYRYHLNSVSNKYKKEQIDSTQKAIQAAFKRRGVNSSDQIKYSDYTGQKIKNVIDVYITWSWWALGSGYLKTARKYALLVAIRRPFALSSLRLIYCCLRGY